jgi:hypothetical protein
MGSRRWSASTGPCLKSNKFTKRYATGGLDILTQNCVNLTDAKSEIEFDKYLFSPKSSISICFLPRENTSRYSLSLQNKKTRLYINRPIDYSPGRFRNVPAVGRPHGAGKFGLRGSNRRLDDGGVRKRERNV